MRLRQGMRLISGGPRAGPKAIRLLDDFENALILGELCNAIVTSTLARTSGSAKPVEGEVAVLLARASRIRLLRTVPTPSQSPIVIRNLAPIVIRNLANHDGQLAGRRNSA